MLLEEVGVGRDLAILADARLRHVLAALLSAEIALPPD
jgi:hypothetical protein